MNTMVTVYCLRSALLTILQGGYSAYALIAQSAGALRILLVVCIATNLRGHGFQLSCSENWRKRVPKVEFDPRPLNVCQKRRQRVPVV